MDRTVHGTKLGCYQTINQKIPDPQNAYYTEKTPQMMTDRKISVMDKLTRSEERLLSHSIDKGLPHNLAQSYQMSDDKLTHRVHDDGVY